MQYRSCPDCGANLDPGEHCDCREEREDASDAAETPSKKMLGTTVSVANQSIDVNACEKLREVRQKTGAMAKDAALIVRDVFPKFNRQLLAQCEAWDKYGIIIHPNGLKAICKAYGLSVDEYVDQSSIDLSVSEEAAPKSPRKKANRKLSRKLTFRMTDGDFERMERRVKKDGFLSVQAWLYFQFTQLLKGDD